MEFGMKVWGKTSPLFNKNNVEIHRLEGKAGGFSSEHRHTAKYNMFLVESGQIEIVCWKGAEGPDKGILKPGQSCVVNPGIFHQFRVVEDCVVYEIYWVDLRADDIERRTVGGMV